MGMTISEAGKRSGCTPPTIRYYERIGLLPRAARTAAGRRTYGWPEVHRLSFIRRSRSFGLSIEMVRTLLAASEASGTACATAKHVVAEHLQAIKRQRDELRALEMSLRTILSRCETGCGVVGTEPCSIFEDIAAAGEQGPRG